MSIQYQPGVPGSISYPYEEYENRNEIKKCRYNHTTSLGTTKGYGRIAPLDETLLRDVVAAVGPVSFALNSALDTFLYHG